MEIDTGSPVCVVPRGVYEKHSQFWPRIQKARVKLSCYLGKLPVLGEIPMKVSYRGETVEAAVTVLDCEGPSLCGRYLIQKLNLQGIPVLSLSGLRESTSQQSQGLQALLREFGDLFTPGLGLIKGPPAHLYLKEGAVPKFCKARPLPYALVFARNYGTGDKWVPGIVKSTSGARMVTVQTPSETVRRHADQLRSRHPTNDEDAAHQPDPGPLEQQAGSKDGGQRHRPSVPNGEERTVQSALPVRRSSRVRKPVERYGF
ncbi:uncharacterized protein LOC135373828 [Ornithodoros turicata]|uniref:uncharacterized protein LOC135373828 n=1 Tax=Ornithodoros turicata TaxID=34597 RepID=UPI00313995C9